MLDPSGPELTKSELRKLLRSYRKAGLKPLPIDAKEYAGHLPAYEADQTARKSKRTLQICLLAMLFVVAYEVNPDEASLWGFKVSASRLPLEMGISLLAILVLLSGLQAIAIDFGKFRRAWLDLRQGLLPRIEERAARLQGTLQRSPLSSMSPGAVIELSSAYVRIPLIDLDAPTPPKEAAGSVCEAITGIWKFESIYRRRRLSYLYDLLFHHIAPVSVPFLCLAIWWLS